LLHLKVDSDTLGVRRFSAFSNILPGRYILFKNLTLSLYFTLCVQTSVYGEQDDSIDA